MLTQDSRPALYETLSEQQALELLDLRILSLIEIDLLPRLTDQRIPDELIGGLASTLQLGSRLYDLDLPALLTPPLTPVEEGELKVESRFSRRYEDQARSDIFGTTASIVEAPKERVAYWCFDLLFSLCRAASAFVRPRLVVNALIDHVQAISKIVHASLDSLYLCS